MEVLCKIQYAMNSLGTVRNKRQGERSTHRAFSKQRTNGAFFDMHFKDCHLVQFAPSAAPKLFIHSSKQRVCSKKTFLKTTFYQNVLEERDNFDTIPNVSYMTKSVRLKY